MKKLLITLFVLISFSVYANAQRIAGTNPGPRSLNERKFKKTERKNDRIRPHRLKMKLRRHRHHRMM
jgi:hypothetical protein